jgi:hypothetical protein
VLVGEYKDDGHTGTLLDRPALNQLRADLLLCLGAVACTGPEPPAAHGGMNKIGGLYAPCLGGAFRCLDAGR